MSEVKEVFARVLDAPEPPLRSGSEMLAVARRSARRRHTAQALAGACAILAVVGGAALVQPRPSGNRAPVGVPPPATSLAPLAKEPAVPTVAAARAHNSAIEQILTGYVPTGYKAAPVFPSAGSVSGGPVTYTLLVEVAKGRYRDASAVRVMANGADGMLMTIFGNDSQAKGQGHDLCATKPELGIEGATISGCTVIDVNGVMIRLVTGDDSGIGEVMSAVRYLRGGYLAVVFSQGTRSCRLRQVGTHQEDIWVWEAATNPDDEPILSTLPFGASRLAAIAADPRILP